jgi:hypothetical protein
MKAAIKSLVRRALSPLKVELIPIGPYSPIPDVAELAQSADWRRPRSLAGVAGADLGGQTAFLDSLFDADIREALQGRDVYAEAAQASGDSGFGAVEAETLYALVRRRKPARILMFGSWISAPVCVRARMDAGMDGELICIDNDPRPWLKAEIAAGRARLTQGPPRATPRKEFDALRAGDVLFLDTSHAVKPGGDVADLVLDILPRLAAGVLVHFHGPNFPYDYGRKLLAGDLTFANEGALLMAFLSGNRDWRIAASLTMLHYGAKEELQRRFPRHALAADRDGLDAGAGGTFPNSLWLEKVG